MLTNRGQSMTGLRTLLSCWKTEPVQSFRPEVCVAKPRVPLITALEPRILFDGAAVADATIALSDVDLVLSPVHLDPSESKASEPLASEPTIPKEVVFIDAALPDYQTLVKGINPEASVYLITAGENGFTTMATVLDNHSEIEAIHVLGHGREGEITLGNGTINGATLSRYSDSLTAIGRALTASGDILLYSCDFAADSQGQTLVNQIAQLTQADIAASDNLTGHEAFAADWLLEVSSGPIEVAEVSVPSWTCKLHTDAVGFDIQSGSQVGTFNVEVFFGSWHPGDFSSLGRAILYTLQPGGDNTNPNHYTVAAYGDNNDSKGSNEYEFTLNRSSIGTGIDLQEAFDKKILKDTLNDEMFFNIKRMNSIKLK